MSYSSTLIFNYFGIPFSGKKKRKIRNEYKTKKTTIQKETVSALPRISPIECLQKISIEISGAEAVVSHEGAVKVLFKP